MSGALRGWFASILTIGLVIVSLFATNAATCEEPDFSRVLPDGRQIYPIGIYQSQMVELIPEGYRPVSIDRLSDALTKLADRATDDQASRIRGAEFWIKLGGDTLVSDRSVLDMESDRDSVVRRSLGRVNLALDPPANRTSATTLDALPRLESSPSGNLVAVFRGGNARRTRIDFKWRLPGRIYGSGHEFTMRIPSTPQTRIVLSAPPNVKVEVLDGVVRVRPGPPSDAGQWSTDRDSRWYEIDAGGLSSVRIRTSPIESTVSESMIVRRSSIQYDVDPAGLNWMQRMSVELAPDQPFPPLKIFDASVTSIKVNAADVTFTQKKIDDRTVLVQIGLPPAAGNLPSTSKTITLAGQSVWSSTCRLPIARWSGDSVIHASAMDEIQMAVAADLEVAAWDLPETWNPAKPQILDGIKLWSASGPPIGLIDVRENSDASKITRSTGGRGWSQVKFAERPQLRASEHWLKLEVGKGSITAKSRLAISVDPENLEPIQLKIQKGFTFENLIFVRSQRSIESPGINEATQTVTLWPEPEDISPSVEGGPTLWIIEATGTRVLATAQQPAVVVPPCWFVGVEGVRGRILAAVIPPADLNWSGEAALQRDRIRPTELTREQIAFLGGEDRATLYFMPALGRTPEVMLEKPSVSFDVSTHLRIRRDGDDVVEQLKVDVQSAGQNVSELVVQTGETDGHTPYHWSLSGENGIPSTSLPPSDVKVGTGEDSGTYTIDVSELNLRGRPLIARRRFPMPSRLEMQLPGVPGAVSQRSEVLMGNGLQIKQRSRSVQFVPVVDQDKAGTSTDEVVFQRLRYDAVEQPSITIEKSNDNGDVTIVNRESIRVIASSRGTDRIEATYELTSTTPLVFDYPPELQLTSIERNGESVNLLSIQQRPIELPPLGKNETIHVVWNRSQYGSLWMRHCRIPRIKVSAVVLKSEYELVAASDTFAPTAIFRGHRFRSNSDAVEIVPGEHAILIRRNIALAAGWLISLITFAIGWTVASRSPLVVAVSVAILIALTILWWPWKLAVIGWLVTPIVAAAMLATCRDWTDRGSKLVNNSEMSKSDSIQTTDDQSADFSWASIVRILLLSTFTSASFGLIASGQETPPPPASVDPKTVPVLVPVDETGKASGDIVYVPRTFHSLLFPSEVSVRTQQPNFQSADYRVRINPVSNSVTSADESLDAINRKVDVTVEAEYLIQLIDGPQNSNRVRLPLNFAVVRRVELVDEVDRIIRFAADEAGQVLASLPKGESFRIRVTMAPPTRMAMPWTKIALAVPPVASSRLTIESEKNVEALRVGGVNGRLLPETDLRRWVTEIGPVDSLEIDYRIANATKTSEAKPLQRRYWVNAGKLQTVIECEIDPPGAVAAGESFQFVIRDAEMPTLTSPDWRRVTTDLYSPTRRLVTMSALRDAPGPIRLLWSRPRNASDIGGIASTPINLPDVIAAALGENAPAWIALHCDRSLSFAPLARDQSEPLSVDQFMAAWSGYRGLIDRALVTNGTLPAIALLPRVTSTTTVTGQHHLHVMPDRLELRYEATVIPGDDATVPHRLSIPATMELVQLSVGGVKQEGSPIRGKASLDFLLGDFSSADPISIVATATQLLPKDLRFTPPRMRLTPSSENTDTYTISRDSSTSLKTIQPVPIELVGPQPKASAESLLQGWIPVSTWVIPGSVETAAESASTASSPSNAASAGAPASSPHWLGGLFQVSARKTRFDCRQLISLSRDEGRWRMETRIKFDTKRIPDFVDIEVPSRWCESLDVSPTTSWSRQPATDPTQQIIRIRCDAGELVEQSISVVGTLQAADAGRVSVPAVRVLGLGRRRVHISVPDKLVNESIQWRTSAVEAVSLPDGWRDAIKNTGQRSTYIAASQSWSIDLAPLPTLNSDAIALAQDNQVLTQSDGILVISHWDFFPGGLESVSVNIPTSATCLGGWSAGQPVPIESLASLDLAPKTNESPSAANPLKSVRIPLSMSRLSQSVELLIRVPSDMAKQGGYVPQLVDIPVAQNWLSIYKQEEPPPGGRISDTSIDQNRRAVSLARSVVESVEQAVDIIAERPTEEVAVWLSPWVGRYQQLATIAGHQAEFVTQEDAAFAETSVEIRNTENPNESESDGSPVLSSDSPPRSSSAAMLQWQLLDERMAVYVSRYMSETKSESRPLFDVAKFDGFMIDDVTVLSLAERAPGIQTVSTNDRGLRDLMMNLLTLTLVTGLLVCMKPIQKYFQPIVVHPAFWLGLIGLCGFVVAPLPVAAAILLVAVLLAVIPSTPLTPESNPRP